MSLHVHLQIDPDLELLHPEPHPAIDLNETQPWLPLRRVRSEPVSDPEIRCIHCQGPMQRGTVPVRLDKAGFGVYWDAFPAWVCGHCETPYFEEREVELVRRALALMKALAA